jgi:release factor glutamine methyltransferase
MIKNVADIIKLFHTELDEVYGAFEAESFARMALEHYSAIPYSNYTAYRGQEINADEVKHYIDAIEKLKKHQPIQYILGVAWFYDLPFKVNTNVLIPRPETEELVDMVIKENPAAKQVVDICTGSGCIAISLKTNLPQAQVWATDWSNGALLVASENATTLEADVNFLHHDALSDDWSILPNDVDVIVSNPPYVKNSEKSGIAPHVLNNEPHMALFVPNDDALLFYRHIAIAAQQKLRVGGRLYFEVHTDHAHEVANLLQGLGFNSCNVVKDIHNRNRMVAATK